METRTKIKALVFTAFLAIAGTDAVAQKTTPSESNDPTSNYDQGFRLGFGLNGGYAFEEELGATLGADVRLQYDFSKKTSITLTTGFTNLFVDGDAKDLGFIPVKGGFKGFIWEDQFYLLGEVGGAIPVTNQDDYEGTSFSETSLLLSPGIGWVPSKYLDVSLRYEHYTNWKNSDGDKGIGQIALRLAYGFKL